MSLDAFAEYYTTRTPIAALVFDNRGHGASEGTPRSEIIPALQMSDIQDAITFAHSLEEVDPQKIALWGYSYSGGHAIQVAAFDRRVKAVLVINPLLNGLEGSSRLVPALLWPGLYTAFSAGFPQKVSMLMSQTALDV